MSRDSKNKKNKSTRNYNKKEESKITKANRKKEEEIKELAELDNEIEEYDEDLDNVIIDEDIDIDEEEIDEEDDVDTDEEEIDEEDDVDTDEEEIDEEDDVDTDEEEIDEEDDVDTDEEEIDEEEDVDTDEDEINEEDDVDTEEEEFDEEDDVDTDEEEIDEEEDVDTNEEEIDEDEDIDTEEEKVEIIKPKKEKKKNKKIEKIEKKAKENKVKTKYNSSSTSDEFIKFFNKNFQMIIGIAIGVAISILVAIIIWPERIATLKDGNQPVVKVGKKTYTATDLYEKMKDHYSVSILLDEIDNNLLTKLYKEDDTMLTKVKSEAQNYLNTYKQYYNYTEEEFLEKNGFANYDEFLNYLKLDYRRKKYLDDYIKKNISDNEIQKYYDEKVFGDINTQHILVEVSTSDNDKKLKDADAKKLAEEIIDKINDGSKWEDIKKEYKEKVTFEDLKYQSWDASLEESFMNALKKMKDNSFSEEPVKTSYGYHIIYRLDQKKKPTLKNAKDKIIDSIITEKKSADTNLQYKALISLREDNKIKFSDTVMKAKYEKYCKQYK